MENKNIFITALENREKKLNEESKLKKFDLCQLGRLSEIAEKNDKFISSALWDLMFFNINDLIVKDNKVCYTSFYKPSKRIMKFLSENNELIIKNFDYIMNGK